MSEIIASGKLCVHGCNEQDNGRCVMGCPRPGCVEYPSPFTEGRSMCWSCGKWLFTFMAANDDRPAGEA